MLRIIDIRPQHGAGNNLAWFDAQLSDDIRMFNLKLIQGPRGRRVYSAHAFGNNVATFSPALNDQLTRAASAALESVNAGVRDAA
jgi:hypothetical protein